MRSLSAPGPQRVGPTPAVLRAIRAEMKRHKLGPQDRRMPSVARQFALEPVHLTGFNKGIFYAPEALPQRVAALAPSQAVRSRPTTGTLKCLVLLVEFPDNKGKRSPDEFRTMLFSKGQHGTGSMREFYAENSCNKLDLEGEVIGWIQLPQPYSYYVNGQSGTGPYPRNAQKMVEDALAAVRNQVKWRDFDQDGDGYLDGLFVVHAGGGAEAETDATRRADEIWSHQFNITQPFVADGVTAYAYCTEPEDGRAGVFCHEFGHMLGLPDLYDTTYRSSGVGVWCVMGAGSWNGGGDTPGHFCAWSRARLGWIKPTVIKSARNLTIGPVEDCKSPVYRLWTKGKPGLEYFLMENRQLIGFDKDLPAGGLLIWHIDDSQHNNDHPGSYWVGLVQADDRRDLEFGNNQGDDGDPYPGSDNNKRFDDKSKPPALDQVGDPTGVSVTRITLKKDTVTCHVSV